MESYDVTFHERPLKVDFCWFYKCTLRPAESSTWSPHDPISIQPQSLAANPFRGSLRLLLSLYWWVCWYRNYLRLSQRFSFEHIPIPSGAWSVHEKNHLPRTETSAVALCCCHPPKKFPLFFGHLHRLCAQNLQVLMPHKRLRHLVFQVFCASPTRGCLMFEDMCIFGHHWPSGLLHVFQREEASVFSMLRILLWSFWGSTDSAVGSGASFAFNIPGCYPILLDIHFRKTGHAVYQQSLRNVTSCPFNVGLSIPFRATAMRKMFTTSVGCPSSYNTRRNKRSPRENLKV